MPTRPDARTCNVQVPFVVPAQVPWGLVASALNLFMQATTQHPLCVAHLEYVASKLEHEGTHALTTVGGE